MTARNSFTATVSTALAAVILVTLTGIVLPQAFAQDKMAPKMGKMSDGKMQSGKMATEVKLIGPFYVSKSTRMAYHPLAAKRMKMTDMKGNKLVKMESIPDGYELGTIGDNKPASKMNKMENGKMQSGTKMSGGQMPKSKM